MFAEARRMLRDTLEHAQARGSHYANLIDDANDIFKDGQWDNFKDWADRNAGWIDGVATALGWVATAAAIGAIFIPGVNVVTAGYLMTMALTATGAAAASHLTLAMTDNGSWLDLGLDIFSLLTFGMGLAAARGLASAQHAARLAATTEAGDRAVAVLRSSNNTRSISLREFQAVRQHTARQISRIPLARASRLEAFLIGGTDEARLANDIVDMATRFHGAPGMAEAVRSGAVYYATAQASHLSGLGADLPGKASDIADASRWLYKKQLSKW